jgi:hypothetical protein
MKKIIALLILGLVTMTQFSQAATEKRTSKTFVSIENNCSIDIIIRQSDSYKIEVIAPEKYLNKIETKVVANTLIVDVHGNIYSTEDFEIRIDAVNINEIVLNGSGDCEMDGQFTGESLSLELNGSGDFEGHLNMKDVEVSLRGSGDAELSGVNGSLDITQKGSGDFEGKELYLGNSYFIMNGSGDIEVSGSSAMMELTQNSSGDFDGRSFKVQTAKITKTSSGEADVFITDKVDAKISGSGDLTIKGNPDMTNFSATGSGDIRSI